MKFKRIDNPVDVIVKRGRQKDKLKFAWFPKRVYFGHDKTYLVWLSRYVKIISPSLFGHAYYNWSLSYYRRAMGRKAKF